MLERTYIGECKTLLKACCELFPEVAYGTICATIRKKDVKINGKRALADSVVRQGDVVSAYFPAAKQTVVYTDDNIAVFYKPKGVASEGEASFEALIKSSFGAEYTLMHRLDTNTDGLLIFAKNAVAEREIYSAMKNGRITKYYKAEVFGATPAEACLKYFYKKSAEDKMALISTEQRVGFMPVELYYKTLSYGQDASLIYVTLHSGKMHQIRAMLAHSGHFILGDGKYGNDKINREKRLKKQQLTACEIAFDFAPESPLFYLNKHKITL